MRTQEEIKNCVEELLSRMTLEEKIGQMVQSAGNDTSAIGGDVDALPLEGQIEQGLVGSVIYINDNAAQARKWQKLAVEKSPPGHPAAVLPGRDPRLPDRVPHPAGVELLV